MEKRNSLMHKRNSLMPEDGANLEVAFFGGADLDSIFEDEGPADEITVEGASASELNESANDSSVPSNDNDKLSQKEEQEDKDNSNDETAKSSGLDKKLAERGKSRRRSSAAIEDAEKGLPPPSWQNEAADRPHREAMIRDITELLTARKKEPPSKEWMQQRPHKVRVLEDKLYSKASSLEAYLDRSTLRQRLQRLAVSITLSYKNLRGRSNKNPSRASFQSIDSSVSGITMTSLGSSASVSGPLEWRAGLSSNFSRPAETTLRRAVSEPVRNPAENNGNNADGNSSTSATDMTISNLERQRALNAQLANQIFEQIRQQQQQLARSGITGAAGDGIGTGVGMGVGAGTGANANSSSDTASGTSGGRNGTDSGATSGANTSSGPNSAVGQDLRNIALSSNAPSLSRSTSLQGHSGSNMSGNQFSSTQGNQFTNINQFNGLQGNQFISLQNNDNIGIDGFNASSLTNPSLFAAQQNARFSGRLNSGTVGSNNAINNINFNNPLLQGNSPGDAFSANPLSNMLANQSMLQSNASNLLSLQASLSNFDAGPTGGTGVNANNMALLNNLQSASNVFNLTPTSGGLGGAADDLSPNSFNW